MPVFPLIVSPLAGNRYRSESSARFDQLLHFAQIALMQLLHRSGEERQHQLEEAMNLRYILQCTPVRRHPAFCQPCFACPDKLLHHRCQCHGGYANHADAWEILQETVTINRYLGYQRGIDSSIDGMACLAEKENRAARAIQLFAAAHTLRLLIAAPLDADVQEKYAQKLANLRARLRDIIFEIELSKGAAMTLDKALDLALS